MDEESADDPQGMDAGQTEGLVTVGEDGQGYMVVEVINVEEDPEQRGDNDDFVLAGDLDSEVLSTLQNSKKLQGEASLLSDGGDMSTCFGFVVIQFISFTLNNSLSLIYFICFQEDDGEIDTITDDKSSIQLLN